MIGPKTKEFVEIDFQTTVAKAMVKILDKVAEEAATIESKAIRTAKEDALLQSSFPLLTLNYSHAAELALVAQGLVKENIVAHPRVIFGNWWFLHYQAWLWKLSQRWREHILEHWLKGLAITDIWARCYPREQKEAGYGILITPEASYPIKVYDMVGDTLYQRGK